jgi:hypothetical protein
LPFKSKLLFVIWCGFQLTDSRHGCRGPTARAELVAAVKYRLDNRLTELNGTVSHPISQDEHSHRTHIIIKKGVRS